MTKIFHAVLPKETFTPLKKLRLTIDVVSCRRQWREYSLSNETQAQEVGM